MPYPSHSGQGAERDAIKKNALQQAGWVVLTFTSNQIKRDPEACIQQVVIELRKAQFKEKEENQARKGSAGLSPREIEILNQVCQGKAYKEVALSLGIKEDTVLKHTQHIRGKLGVESLTAACVRAVVLGLVDYRLFN